MQSSDGPSSLSGANLSKISGSGSTPFDSELNEEDGSGIGSSMMSSDNQRKIHKKSDKKVRSLYKGKRKGRGNEDSSSEQEDFQKEDFFDDDASDSENMDGSVDKI